MAVLETSFSCVKDMLLEKIEETLVMFFLCNPVDYSTPGFPVLLCLPELAQTCIHWADDAIQPSHPVPSSSFCPQSFPASESFPVSQLLTSILKYWSFIFSISPSSEYSGLIYFRIDWFDLLAVQGTLKSPLQHHSLKASILWCSIFFMVQISHFGWLLEKLQ